MHVENGSEVTVLYLTDGGGLGQDREGLIAARRAEARAVGERLGLRQIFWDRADTRLTNDESTVSDLAQLLGELEPEWVYTPSFFDRHYDHFSTNQVFVDALARRPELDLMVRRDTRSGTRCPSRTCSSTCPTPSSARKSSWRCTRFPTEYTDFAKLCRYRSSVHYTLFIDSRKERADRGFAEAFLRFDGATYARLQAAYVACLREDKSSLVDHIAPRGPAGTSGSQSA